MTAQLLSPHIREAHVFPKINWQQFEAIDQAFDSVPGVKFRYLDGALEIMPISEEHEDFKTILRMLLEAYLRSQGIRFYGRGGPSLGDATLGTRSEPDEAYNIGERKPYPDLVIEVVVTSGGIDKLEGYRRLAIAEVWFWEDGVLQLYHLKSDQSAYEQVENSVLLPQLPLDVFCRYVTYHDQFDAVDEFLKSLP
ncbi:Uma2 family endonuclease [Leptolyngbya iicbica]|uniref:Uma2 family endonuclease n=2 Tax=Cyanophyceae TaxID=3028117 RepID=A0A4Q7EEM4_9CYAN|nr:Uma2 family endonuclease [Leptolyngbya sp. LK]RZM82284.1 Uma2 family endonuclease [Leptolyngbya sp. LK]